MSKNSFKSGLKVENLKSKNFKFFKYLCIGIFVCKLILIARISPLVQWTYQGKIWLGADGENYLIGVNALSRDGLLSNQEILNYWPAGYPILIYIFGIFGKTQALTLLSVFQSFAFSYSTYVISKEIFNLGYRKAAKIICVFLLLNPTLTLSSMAVGYESLVASGYLFIISLSLKVLKNRKNKQNEFNLILVAVSFSFICALQPRLILSAIIFALILSIRKVNLRESILKVIIFLVIISSFPALLVARNHFASGLNVLSLNLGTTMNIGAGDGATGGYMATYKGVPCKLTSESEIREVVNLPSAHDRARVLNDNARVRCVLNWYVENPKEIPRLTWNKSVYFWSPWIGPLTQGTMARNPWYQNNPLREIAKSPSGYDLVYGNFGKIISWIWLIFGFMLMLIGCLKLLRLEELNKYLGIILAAIIFPSWLVSLVTLGDNRFRLPILGATIILQIFGLLTLFRDKSIHSQK